MPGWNIADVLDVVADAVPESAALVHGDRRFTWREFNDRASRVGAYLRGAGLGRQDKVVQYLRNCPEYLESFLGTLKASLVPVNTNYRYGPSELTYLWRDCDARAVVFAGSFTDTIEKMRHEVPDVLAWLWVDDHSQPCPAWAQPYEAAIASTAPLSPGQYDRDGDDLVLLYTGGTTGLPKGVMWRQDDLMVLLGNASSGRYPDEPDLEYARSRVASAGRCHLPAAPLMHGAGCLTCLPIMARGGAVVLLTGASFRAEELLDTIERDRVNSVGWVGDAFAKPVLEALDREPHRWNLDSWSVITSGGVGFSTEVKQGLLRHLPQLTIADVYGSTEAISAGRSISTAAAADAPRAFKAEGTMLVLNDAGTEVVAGSGEVGKVAYTGRIPLGYYKDPAKTAATFRTINGRRYVFTGDFATVDADSRVNLLGRGSSCINTGGEKVYPEEVEEVLKGEPSVADVVVVGLPDDRFGEKVAAVVQLAPGYTLDVDVLQAHVRSRLAPYKAPRVVVAAAQIPRGPNGKPDMPLIREMAVSGATRA